MRNQRFHASVQHCAGLCAQVEEDPDSRDAESRVCAVRALGAVACKLCGGDGGVPQLRARQLLPRVHDALLTAMEDYSTDSRCAAMRNTHVFDAQHD